MQKSFYELDAVRHDYGTLLQEFSIVSHYDEYDDEDDYDYDDEDYEDEDEYDDEDEDDYSEDDEDAYLEASTVSDFGVFTQEASAQKCLRCWKYEASNYHNDLCSRCQETGSYEA